MNNDNFYRTTELSLATYLIGCGAKYINVEIIASSVFRFIFENSRECYDLEEEYFRTKKELLQEANELKDGVK